MAVWRWKNIKLSRKTKILVLSAALLIILLIIASYMFFNFMIREEIILDVSPDYSYMKMRNGDSYSLPLQITVNNNWLCNAKCSYKLMDISNYEIIASSSFAVRNHKAVSIDNEFILDEKGYGQKIIEYIVECHNNPTSACPSDNSTYRRRSIIIINYSPSAYQESLIDSLKREFSTASSIASGAANALQTVRLVSQMDELKSSNTDADLVRQIDDYESGLLEVKSYWDAYNYDQASSIFNSRAMLEAAYDLSSRATASRNFSILLIGSHNAVVKIQHDSISRLDNFHNYSSIYPDDDSYEAFSQDMMLAAELIDRNTAKIINKDFQSYDELLRETGYAAIVLDRIQQHKDDAEYSSRGDMVDIFLAGALACIDEHRRDCKNIIKTYQENYSISNRCMLVNGSVSLLTNSSSEPNDQEQALVMLSLLSAYNETGNNDNATAKRLNYYYDSLISLLPNDYNKTLIKDYYPDLLALDNDTSSWIQGLRLLDINFRLESISDSCSRNKVKIKLDPFDMQPLSVPQQINTSIRIMIDDPKSKCCAYGLCIECCPGCRPSNPLILLHGHSFNQKNSAYQSTEVFNKLEDDLVEGKHYISIGIPSSIPYDDGTLGLYGIPILAKPTYYITSFNDALGITVREGKSGNIDTYALRLKENIDQLKRLTNTQKVDIIAHSMGGLVVRRYIQIFGSDSIGKLILVGSPNAGIVDSIYNYCKLFGEVNECNDIHSGSLFLKKLNDMKSFPEMPETHIIAGSGCITDNEDSDGIVTVRSASLEGYEPLIIKGSCHGTELLHSDMLDTDNHPEFYDAIISMLRKK